MNFTFGIITAVDATETVDSIKIPDAEIIVVGGKPIGGVRHIPFDETIRPAWITRKKNIITQEATHENIVYMHDYLVLGAGWYDGFLRFGNDWDVCMNIIANKDGTRYRDWVTWDDPKDKMKRVDYSYTQTQFMYISGAYWVAKKRIMEANPLDEGLSWGQGEDVEWSKRIRDKYNYKMNPYSKVCMLKQKGVIAT